MRVMVYDLHTLQNRFYFSNHAVATLHSTFPLIIREIRRSAARAHARRSGVTGTDTEARIASKSGGARGRATTGRSRRRAGSGAPASSTSASSSSEHTPSSDDGSAGAGATQDEHEQLPAIDCVAFPDDGAEKRYRHLFARHLPAMQFIVCAKKRDENDPLRRVVTIKDGIASGRHILIVDDMLQSGGTLTQCARMLLKAGAASIRGFCAHAVLPGNSIERFLPGGDRAGVFQKIFVTDSCPTSVARFPAGNCVFKVLSLAEQVMEDL